MKRGFLRAWLTLSICYIAYSGVLTWQDLPVVRSPASRAEFVITGSPWMTTALADMKRWRAERNSSNKSWSSSDQPEWVPKTEDDLPRYKSAEDWPDYNPTKDRHSMSYLPTEQDRQEAIIDGVKWALIPPALLLAAGFMVGWTIRGFGRA